MKESLSIINKAEDFVIEIEDQWVNEQFENVDQLHRRAKGSGTLIAQHEFESAKQKLSDELERLAWEIPNPEE